MKKIVNNNNLLKSTIRLNFILASFVLLSFNSFAWFVYSTRVETSIETSVKAWQVEFENDEHEVAHQIKFEIDSLFPGMVDYNNYINIINYGDTEALVHFEVQRVKIYEVEYTIDEYSHEDMIYILLNDFPFKIDLSTTGEYLEPNLGEVRFIMDVSWDFESGDDALDTYWGHKAFLYQQENPDSAGLEISVILNAVQTLDD